MAQRARCRFFGGTSEKKVLFEAGGDASYLRETTEEIFSHYVHVLSTKKQVPEENA
jgi:hypothetical protein